MLLHFGIRNVLIISGGFLETFSDSMFEQVADPSENKTAPSARSDSAAWCPKPGSNRHVF